MLDATLYAEYTGLQLAKELARISSRVECLHAILSAPQASRKVERQHLMDLRSEQKVLSKLTVFILRHAVDKEVCNVPY